jgi:hypothetical protein
LAEKSQFLSILRPWIIYQNILDKPKKGNHLLFSETYGTSGTGTYYYKIMSESECKTPSNERRDVGCIVFEKDDEIVDIIESMKGQYSNSQN